MSWVQTIVGIASFLVVLLLNILFFGNRIGKFEGKVMEKLEHSEQGRKENKEAIEKSRTESQAAVTRIEDRVQGEIRELRRDQETKFNELFKLLVKPRND
jgi:predicted Holliday junction resolvase-like endonuclease